MKLIVGLVLSALVAVIAAKSNKDVYECTVNAKKTCFDECKANLTSNYDASVFSESKICYEKAKKERTECVKNITGLHEYGAKPCSWHRHKEHHDKHHQHKDQHHKDHHKDKHQDNNLMVDCLQQCKPDRLKLCFEGCANEKGHHGHGKSKSSEHPHEGNPVRKALDNCKEKHDFKACSKSFNNPKP